MQEDGAASARNDGRVVEAQNDKQVVKMIIAPQSFGTRAIRSLDASIVEWIEWCIAPAIVGLDLRDR